LAENASSDKLFVARQDDLERLRSLWEGTRAGNAAVVHLNGPLGSGKRALVGELCRSIIAEDDDVLLWRVNLQDEEDGLQTLIRIYAGLLTGLHRQPVLRGKIEMALNSQIPHQTQRVQQWYRAFIEGVKKGAPKGDNNFQVILPRDNPLIGIVEITLGIARKFPVLLDIQGVHNVHSLAVHAMLEGLYGETHDSDGEPTQLMLVLGTEDLSEENRRYFPLPMLDFLDRRAEGLQSFTPQSWTETEVGLFLKSKGLESDAARIAEVAGGRPGFVAELTDWLVDQDKLAAVPAELTLASIADTAPDPDELDEPEGEPEGNRTHASAEHAAQVAYLGALLGLSFPSGLVADMGGYDRESVDDLLDATEHLYKELQFSEPLGTWIYQFHKALLRESVLSANANDEGRELARRVGMFMERFLVPRGYGYLVKAMRVYARAGEANRAGMLRSRALASDQPQVWAMVQDLIKYFDDVDWPDPMRRTVYMNLLDRMVQGGDVNQTEGLYNQAMAWATEKEDRPMQAWLLFAGSRLDHRRQDIYRARDRANDALKMYGALGDKLKSAELRMHLAMIELADGNTNASLDQAAQAEELAKVPPIEANAEFVRGQVAKRGRKFQDAIKHFTKANEIAGRAGVAALALEAGLNLGETLLVSGQHSNAADVLGRVTQIAAQLNNPVRLRAASALLAQSHAALKNFEAALQAATRTLELTQKLKFNRLEAIDLYNVGLFNLMLKRPTEAVSLFRQAKDKMDATEPGFQKELLFNLGGALASIGEKSQAEDHFKSALAPATQAKDWRKVTAIHRQLAGYEAERGDRHAASALLQQALQSADKGNLKEERKAIRRQLDSLK